MIEKHRKKHELGSSTLLLLVALCVTGAGLLLVKGPGLIERGSKAVTSADSRPIPSATDIIAAALPLDRAQLVEQIATRLDQAALQVDSGGIQLAGQIANEAADSRRGAAGASAGKGSPIRPAPQELGAHSAAGREIATFWSQDDAPDVLADRPFDPAGAASANLERLKGRMPERTAVSAESVLQASASALGTPAKPAIPSVAGATLPDIRLPGLPDSLVAQAHFARGRMNLTADGQRQAAAVAEQVDALGGGARVRIVAFAGSAGPDAESAGRLLEEKRARSIALMLTRLGLDEDRIELVLSAEGGGPSAMVAEQSLERAAGIFLVEDPAPAR